MDVFSFKRWAELQRPISPGEFYQHLASELIKAVQTKEVLSQLGNDLINLAEYAYSLRRMDTLEQISQILLSLPLACEYRSIARYYQALCIKRKGRFSEARTLLERIAEEAPIGYRARAIQSIGSIAFDSGDFQSALPFYIEASKAATRKQGCDPLAAFYTQHMMAVLRSIDGDNRGALEDLQSMFPLARAVGSAYPPIYCNYLNSLAVELTEAGRLQEAEHACRITLAPWFANAYPEVRETWDDIALRGRRASRSFVSFAKATLEPDNLFHLPVQDHFGLCAPDSSLAKIDSSARVLNFQSWKKTHMPDKTNDTPNDKLSNQPGKQMTTSERIIKIMNSINSEMTDDDLDRIIELLDEIQSKKSCKS